MAWQKIRIEIPEGYTKAEREQIGQDMLVMIKDRSALGTGVKRSGNKVKTYDFPEYSEEYRKKKGSSRVDLVLDDNMLDAAQVLSTTPKSILLGYENGSKENAKAEGNQIGSYGRSPNPKKARRFLDITDEEKEAILAGYEEPK